MNQLEFMEGFMWKAEEKRITIVEAGCDEAVDKDGGGVGSEGGAETVDGT